MAKLDTGRAARALRALGGVVVKARGPIVAALAASAATAAAFTIFSENRPRLFSRRAKQIDSTSPFADTPLPDLPPPRDGWSFIYAVALRAAHDNMSLVAAGVAFYLLLAIFPALLMFVSIYGLFLSPQAAAGQAAAATAILPDEAAALIKDVLVRLAERTNTDLNVTALISLLVATWSARNGVAAMMTGVNIANDTAETRGYAELQLLSIVLTIGALIGVAVAMTVVSVAPLLLSVSAPPEVVNSWLLWSRWPVLFVFAYAAISLLYKLGPARVLHNWRFFNLGAATATMLWFFGSLGFSAYASRIAKFDATYGSIGAVVILLFWFWLSALFVLLGAEIEAELAEMQTDPKGETQT
jgi:membrane protein